MGIRITWRACWNTELLGPTLRVSDSVGLEQGLRIYIFIKFPDGVKDPQFERHWPGATPDQPHGHPRGSCWKCRFSGPTPGLLNWKLWGWAQNLCFNKPPIRASDAHPRRTITITWPWMAEDWRMVTCEQLMNVYTHGGADRQCEFEPMVQSLYHCIDSSMAVLRAEYRKAENIAIVILQSLP